MSVSVILPTYRRPALLRGCLEALTTQSQPPIEIIVGRRSNDELSADVLASYYRSTGGLVREAVVGPEDNLVASMSAALACTNGDLVALTDDDAEAPRDWLERMASNFDDPRVGGVGGRDHQPHNPGESEVVGVLRWSGRLIGNHHLAVGPTRDVDVLKGVNCCFRGELIREIGFDRRLRGRGNVSHWELGLSFAVAKCGYRLIMDPSLTVLHHAERRMDGDVNARGGFSPEAFVDDVHNETLCLLEKLPLHRRVVYIAYCLGIGSTAAPGPLLLPRSIARHRRPTESFRRMRCGFQGRMQGMATYFRNAFGRENSPA